MPLKLIFSSWIGLLENSGLGWVRNDGQFSVWKSLFSLSLNMISVRFLLKKFSAFQKLLSLLRWVKIWNEVQRFLFIIAESFQQISFCRFVNYRRRRHSFFFKILHFKFRNSIHKKVNTKLIQILLVWCRHSRKWRLCRTILWSFFRTGFVRYLLVQIMHKIVTILLISRLDQLINSPAIGQNRIVC